MWQINEANMEMIGMTGPQWEPDPPKGLFWVALAILAGVLLLGLFGCGPSKKEMTRLHQRPAYLNGYEVIVIDSCEYLQYAGKMEFTHKGNNKNCRDWKR